MKLCRMPDAGLPGLYEAANRTSIISQVQYLRAIRSRLGLGVIAATISIWNMRIGTVNVFALVAALAFLGSLAIEIWLLTAKPECKWYDGRAVAESTRTLAWRYAVGAHPFPISHNGARLHFLTQLNGLLVDAPSTGITPTRRSPITEEMESLRDSSLETRRNTYLLERVAHQQLWYQRKSEYNGKMAGRWGVFLIVTELCGVLFTLGRAGGLYDIDMAAVLAAVMGAGAGWVGVRQFRSLECAYAFANHELNLVHARLSREMSESEWAEEASGAEEAISREHTMWRASRSYLGIV